jgi:hypothetical protein
MDLRSLDYSEFELLIGLLLKREGYEILKTPAPPGHVAGADYEVIDPSGSFRYVEIKHISRPATMMHIDRFIADVDRWREADRKAGGLFVVSSSLTHQVTEKLAQKPHIIVWDGSIVAALLKKHPDIEVTARKAATARMDFMVLQSTLTTGLAESKSAELVKRLKEIAPGKEGWRDFEIVGVDILSHIFSPDLGAPEIQSRSDDGLDIIDAIFPIRSRDQPWSSIRSEHRTRFVVAEFKNYADPITQKQVESIAQYLWEPAKRNFGLLVSRSTPSDSAVAARRRAWLESEKCIVFLSDDNLIEMLQSTDGDADPFEIIDTQLEDFFRSLTP